MLNALGIEISVGQDHNLIASTPESEAEITQLRPSIWELCAKVKDAIASGEGRELVNPSYHDSLAMHVISEGV